MPTEKPFEPNVKVRIWTVQDRRGDKAFTRPWIVRWRVGVNEFQRAYRTKQQADVYRSRLLLAQRSDESFSVGDGEPHVWNSVDEAAIGVHVWVRRCVDEQWADWQPRTRTSAVGELARFVRLCVQPDELATPSIERYLRRALRTDFPATERDVDVEALLVDRCLSLGGLTPLILSDVDRRLGLKLDGSPSAANTARRYRTQARSVVQRAVDLELLERNPWPARKKGTAKRKNRRKAKLDIRQLPNHETMQLALAAIINFRPESWMYYTMTSTAYYAGLRPSEIVMLRPKALTLPAEGWGLIEVTEADIDFDEPGEPKTGSRDVPIPPVLVAVLCEWLDGHDFTPDQLMFRTRNDNRPTSSNWLRSWHRALVKVGHRPLRIYDCRHAAATMWIAAGVPLGEVARRLGHSVEVLVATYLGALDEDITIANTRIDTFLSSS